MMTELKRTHNGLWVDPDDQSTWLYHQWLVGETFTLHPEQRNTAPILAPTSQEEKISVLKGEIQMLEDLLLEEPESKCMSAQKTTVLMVGCLISLAVYKLALARVLGTDLRREVIDMIGKLEKGDQMRAGQYKEWRTALEQN